MVKELIISDKNWTKFQAISEGKGVDETLSLLMSLYEKEEAKKPTIDFGDQYKLIESHFDTAIESRVPIVLEIAMEIKGGGIKFSRGQPKFNSKKGQTLKWAIQSIVLKNYKKRGIKNVEFYVVPEEERCMNLTGTTETSNLFSAEELSKAVGLKLRDFLKLQPKVELKLSNRFSYEYIVHFENDLFPDYFQKKDKKFSARYLDVNKKSGGLIEQMHEQQYGEVSANAGWRQLKIAFLAKEKNLTFPEANKAVFNSAAPFINECGLYEVGFEWDGKADKLEVPNDRSAKYHAFRHAFPFQES
ncbi:hypothetical protein QTO02_00160 [Vibrio fortis]